VCSTLAATVAALFLAAGLAGSEETHIMQMLDLTLNGKPVALDPGPRVESGAVTVPLHAFVGILGAEAKRLEAGGPLAVCKGDLCIPIEEEVTAVEGGTLYAPLAAFIEPLGFQWQVSGRVLALSEAKETDRGLGIGDRPPGFTLPDLYTGEPVSLGDHLGKKAVFYMWASW
jgi:hypothetical protein